MLRNLAFAVSLSVASGVFAVEAPVPTPHDDAAADPALRRADSYFQLMRARYEAGQGRIPEAVNAVREAVGADPDSADLLAEGARLLMQLGRRAEADRMARRATEIVADQATAIRVLADLANARAIRSDADVESRDEAIRLYQTLAAQPRPDPEVFLLLARLRALAGDRSGAAEAARTFASRRPGDAGAIRVLAQALTEDRRDGEAIDAVAAFLSTNPDARDLVPLLADLTRKTGRWDLAETACNSVLAAEPRSMEALALRGEARLRAGREREALEDLEAAMSLDPSDALVRFHLGMAYAEVGRLSDAARIGTQLVREMPGHAGAAAFVGEVLARMGDTQGALDSYEAALRGFGASGAEEAERRDEIRRRMVAILLLEERFAEARDRLETMERRDAPETAELAARTALGLGNDADLSRALESLRRGGAAGLAKIIEGEALARAGKKPAARSVLDEAVEILGSAARPRVAEILRRAGDGDGAERVLRDWARREPSSGVARFSLGALLERLGRFDAGEAELREALRLEPANPVFLNYLGYSLADRGLALGEALSLVKRALEVDPWNGAYLDSLGWVLFKSGRFAEAREPLERAAREVPKDPVVLEHLGDVRLKLGETSAAIEAWGRALQSKPENPDGIRAKIAGAERALRAAEGAERSQPPDPRP